jgi:alcohol dehydrogenase
VNSIRCLRKRGRHVQVGLLLADDRTVAIPMDRVIARELTLHGVHGMAVGGYDALLATIARGALDPSRLVGRTIALEQAGAELAAMGDFAQRGVTVIRF